jgi:hypothetical protein
MQTVHDSIHLLGRCALEGSSKARVFETNQNLFPTTANSKDRQVWVAEVPVRHNSDATVAHNTAQWVPQKNLSIGVSINVALQ